MAEVGVEDADWLVGQMLRLPDGPVRLSLHTGTGPPRRSSADAGVMMDDSYGMEQVVVPPAVQRPLREWLTSRGLSLFPIPVEDDLPTFGIGAIDRRGEGL